MKSDARYEYYAAVDQSGEQDDHAPLMVGTRRRFAAEQQHMPYRDDPVSHSDNSLLCQYLNGSDLI